MMRMRHGIVLVVVLILGLAAGPAVAVAAPAAAAAKTPPLAAGPFDAQIWPGQSNGQTAVIVDVTIDPKVKLPVRVRIPVPQGAVVQWAGEILGASAATDQERPFTVHQGAGGNYAEFTLAVSRRGQIETDGIPMLASGTQIQTQVKWVQSVASTSTQLTVRMPAGISAVKIDPAPIAPPDKNAAGEALYTLAPLTLATGASANVNISYNSVPAGEPTPAGSNGSAIYIVLGVLLVVAVAIVAFLFVRQRGNLDDDDGEE